MFGWITRGPPYISRSRLAESYGTAERTGYKVKSLKATEDRFTTTTRRTQRKKKKNEK